MKKTKELPKAILLRLKDDERELISDLIDDSRHGTASQTILDIVKQHSFLSDQCHDYRQELRQKESEIEFLKETIKKARESFRFLSQL